MTLEGIKIICVLLRKPQIKFGTRCPESIKFPTITKYQKTKKNHLETQKNAQNNKRQNLSIKTTAAW
jgi:hypothetical protein